MRQMCKSLLVGNTAAAPAATEAAPGAAAPRNFGEPQADEDDDFYD